MRASVRNSKPIPRIYGQQPCTRMCRRYVWNVQPKHFSLSLVLKETDQRVSSLTATNFSQQTDTYCEVCLWLDRLTQCEQQQQQLFGCRSTSPLSLYLALVQAPSLRCATYLILSSGPGRQWWNYHRHPQRGTTLPSESLPLWLRNAIFSGKPTTTKKTPARTKVKQSRAIQNLKYVVSRWGASFSAEVNAAGFLKQQPSSHRVRKVNLSADNKTKELGIFVVNFFIDCLRFRWSECCLKLSDTVIWRRKYNLSK